MSSINDDISRPLLHVSNLVNNANNITNLHNTTLGATNLESRILLDVNNDSLDQLLNLTEQEEIIEENSESDITAKQSILNQIPQVEEKDDPNELPSVEKMIDEAGGYGFF
jgi:hypothetical protein